MSLHARLLASFRQFRSRSLAPGARALPWLRAVALGVLVPLALAACGSVPVASLWKLRKLNLETLDPAALRAAVVHSPVDRRTIGVLSIAGPSARLPEARLHELAPLLLAASAELSATSQASDLFA